MIKDITEIELYKKYNIKEYEGIIFKNTKYENSDIESMSKMVSEFFLNDKTISKGFEKIYRIGNNIYYIISIEFCNIVRFIDKIIILNRLSNSGIGLFSHEKP